jgi:hypothetical protein
MGRDFSLIWVSSGFLVFELLSIQWWRLITDSSALSVFIIFGAWWGFGILLAISGLKIGVRISVLASTGTILRFFCFVRSILPRFGTSLFLCRQTGTGANLDSNHANM